MWELQEVHLRGKCRLVPLDGRGMLPTNQLSPPNPESVSLQAYQPGCLQAPQVSEMSAVLLAFQSQVTDSLRAVSAAGTSLAQCVRVWLHSHPKSNPENIKSYPTFEKFASYSQG